MVTLTADIDSPAGVEMGSPGEGSLIVCHAKITERCTSIDLLDTGDRYF